MSTPIDPKQLTYDLGGKWHQHYGTAPCPICQPQRRKDQNALSVTVRGEVLLMHCKKSGCDFRDILTASGIAPGHVEIDHMAIAASERERQEQAEKIKARCRSIWEYGQPIEGTKGEAYLRGRGITCPLPASLRWLADAYHGPSASYLSAMVADVTPTGGIHRTFFTKKGQRLQDNAKMMLGPCQGGAVRLSEAFGPLVACEGIETGLSLLSGLLSGPHSVWAALSTSGLRGLSLPSRTGALIIATDGDPGGRDAGNVLAHRASQTGWEVSLMTAPDKQDWNDVLQSGVVA
ncbi:toprim domain-containing protein [uncultured Roseobacter sp.]|uniref:DUF7146 domain-containing protein n=1 Tax=uncultured Roseobacter sp. TaxID=114847 RepID=UPI00262F32E6|nr:toprim domain-containing protein [uncultured Roseobacter sp.]